MDFQQNLGGNLEAAFHEHIQGMGNNSLRGILDRYDSVERLALLDLLEHRRDRFERHQLRRQPELLHGCQMAEGGFRSQEGHFHGGFQGQAGRDDLTVDAAQGIIGKWPWIIIQQAFIDLAFTAGYMKLLVAAGLETTDFQHHLRALVEKVDDAVIDTVNFGSQFFDCMCGLFHGNHLTGRWIKRVKWNAFILQMHLKCNYLVTIRLKEPQPFVKNLY